MKLFSTILMTMMSLLVVSCGKDSSTPDNSKPESKIVLQAEEDAVSISEEGGEFTIAINSNVEFDIQIGASWISILNNGDVGSETYNCKFTSEINSNLYERSCQIKFVDKNDKYIYTIVEVKQVAGTDASAVVNLIDQNATEMTKNLYSHLWTIADKGFMFGHHDDLWYGRYWYNIAGKSDTKDVCGDYPAVFSVDFGPMMDDRYQNNTTENDIRLRVIREASRRGEVILACCHLDNPQTGGDAWDNSDSNVVKNILSDGNSTRTKYLKWLDRLASIAGGLKDDDGNLIPVIFRPYHEHTQTWSWWGSQCTTEKEFIDFWRMTIEYLRDTKGVHNFIYAISPQMDATYSDTRSRLLFRWPGNDYVDFIGMDCYQGLNVAAFESNLKALTALSIEKKKPCGVTETGQESFENIDYWTKYILQPLNNQRISMVVMWRNKYVSTESDKHFYSVYPGHPSVDDFITMYNDSRSIFSSDLPDMYSSNEKK